MQNQATNLLPSTSSELVNARLLKAFAIFFDAESPECTLFVFSIGSREQNGVSLLTPVSYSVFIALSSGTFLSSGHGSFKNHQLKDI